MKCCKNFVIALLIISFHCLVTSKNITAGEGLPQAKILILENDEDSDLLESRAGNKTQKILTRPLKPQTTTTTPYNPYFLHPYPQNQYFGPDSAALGSGPHMQIQPPPPPPSQIQHHQQPQQQLPAGNTHQYAGNKGQDEPPSGIPDIYIQLIGAMEKLVGRMDKLDTRLRTVENILYHMTNKKEDLPEQGSCPNDFRKVEGVRGKCYKISSFMKSPSIYDWKSAENECTRVGGRLVEMLNYDDFLRVSQFLVKYSTASNSATSDYWIGGINPGLIWIWAESGQPVDMNKRFWNDNDNSSTAPGCLKLSFSHRLNTHFFKHSPCGHSQNYICEIMDNTVSRALANFEEMLWSENSMALEK